jgi:hypothetical protein
MGGKSEITKFAVGDRVCHADIYHVRGASVGTIEAITAGQGWYRVWWEEDGENQITGAFRTYEDGELSPLD